MILESQFTEFIFHKSFSFCNLWNKVAMPFHKFWKHVFNYGLNLIITWQCLITDGVMPCLAWFEMKTFFVFELAIICQTVKKKMKFSQITTSYEKILHYDSCMRKRNIWWIEYCFNLIHFSFVWFTEKATGTLNPWLIFAAVQLIEWWMPTPYSKLKRKRTDRQTNLCTDCKYEGNVLVWIGDVYNYLWQRLIWWEETLVLFLLDDMYRFL